MPKSEQISYKGAGYCQAGRKMDFNVSSTLEVIIRQYFISRLDILQFLLREMAFGIGPRSFEPVVLARL